MRKIILLAITLVTISSASAQDFSNKGKDFWVAYGYHQQMTNQPPNPGGVPGGSQDMLLYFATDQVTTITVTIPGIVWTRTYTSGAGNTIVTSDIIPKTLAMGGDACLRAESNSPENKGIHITSDKPIVAYAHVYNGSVSGATILYPTNTLGKEYYSVNYDNISNSANANSWFYVIAADTGTTQIEITPIYATINHPAGVPFTVTLSQGQVYSLFGAFIPGSNPVRWVDLTGSKIRSLATGNGGCKKIAVFSGSGRISLTCNGASSSSDNYMVQALPKSAWGKNYLTVPTAGYNNIATASPYAFNLYRVCVTDVTTKVFIDGVITTLPLIDNFYYNIPTSNTTHSITADKSIMVAQYLPSRGNCGNVLLPAPNVNDGDPEVIYLSPVEQSIKQVTWNACRPAAININKHYLNFVIPNGGTAISSCFLDGIQVPAANFVVHPQNSSYSYATINVSGTNNTTLSGIPHTLISDSGFNAIAYGYGAAESYGYNAGTNVRDLTQALELETQYGNGSSNSVCTNSPFRFKFYFPDSTLTSPPDSIRFDSLRWAISNPAIIVPSNFPILQINPTIDSTTIKNGRRVNWYSIPGIYFFNTAGVDTLFLTTYRSSNEGCGNELVYPFPITISNPPVADFTWTPGGCVAEPFQFTETTPQTPDITYRWYWDFGDGNTSTTVRNPSHLYTAPGTYTVRYAAITTPGCLTDTIEHTIVVPDLPNATISGSTAVCVNAPTPFITFTGTDGTPGYTFTYTINGGAPQTVSSPGASTTITIPVSTATAGVFTYNLISVNNTGSTLCTRSITGQSAIVTVNPLPTASISGTTAVCQNAVSPLITFTGATGTAPYTFTYNINGGANQSVTTVSGNWVTIAAPTNVVGTFSYNLVSVLDGSTTLCTQAQSGSAVVTVNPLPTATISGTTSVCLNAASPNVTFTGAVGSAPYTFTYNINGGANQTVTTVAGNSVTVAAPTNVLGTFIYNLVSVQDGSSTTCSQAQSGSAIITVNDLPTATIAGTITVCLNAPSPNITFTGANTTSPYTFSYTINGGPIQTVTTVSGNSVTVPVPTNVAGTFTYDLVSVQDGSSTLCSQAQTGSAVVTVNPLPTATIAGNTTVCRNAASPLITFTGAVGTAPYTFTYNINGGANQTVTTVVGNSVTVPAPTNVIGVFTYNLVSVQEGSPNACSQAQSGSAVVTVNELPTASISGTIEVCLNEPSPLITFTGAGTVAPYTFTYTINGGPNQTVTTVAGNSVTIPVPTGVAGTFTYTLVSVQDGSSTTCSQAQTGSAVVTVHPLPTANFNFSAISCETRTINFTDLSVPNVGTLTGWAWNFGDPASGGNNTSTSQNPTHTFATAGTYTVTLIVTSSKGCSNLPFTRLVTINNRPQAGYIIPEVCLSDTYAQFIDTSSIASGAIVAWEWYFDDPFATPGNPNTSTLQNPTHSYTAVGIYDSVQLIVTSALGCRDTIIQTLVVNGSNPYAIFNVNNPTTLCANDSVAIVEASTVFPGVITKIEIYWDNVNFPSVFDLDNNPFTGKVYRHLYPNFQTPLSRVFQIRYRAYSGGVCVDDSISNITVNAAPLVQFNNMPDTCLLAAPFQLTQASEIGGVPGSGVFSGPGVTSSGIFTPMTAGIGTHTILYTFTSTVGGCVDTMSNTIVVLDTAHAAFTFVAPSCEQTPTSFTDISTWPPTVAPFNTVWDFGDGSPIENRAPGTTFGHLFPAPGTYTVTMYNVSAYGCNSTVTSQQVTVDSNHTITLTSGSNNQTVCINNAITNIVYTLAGGANNATVTGLPSGVNYSIAGNVLTITGSPNSNAGGPIFNYSILTSGNTCVVDTANGVITVDPDHTLAFSSGDTMQSVCVNTPIDPIIYTIGGGANNVTIGNLPPGVTGTVVGNILTISGTPTTTTGGPLFTYTIQTTGNSCIKANAAGEIIVNPYPVPNFAADKPSYCIPNAIVIFNNSSTMPDGSGMTYFWNFGEPSSGNLDTSRAFRPSHWYSGTGPFDVRLVVTSTAVLNGNVIGCAHDTTIRITTIHPQPKADFVFNKPSVCIGDNVTLTDNTDGKDGIVNQWSWNMGDRTTRATNPVTYTYTDTITYTITMFSVNSHGCNSDTVTKPFTVYPYPYVNAGPDRFVLEGGSIQLETITFANAPQYVWTPNLYLTDNRVARPRVVDPKTDMTYRLTVTGRGGCALSDDVFVKLLKFPVIPNTFTPNNDGINDFWRIDFLNTYPNNRVQIFTRAGNLVFESRGYNTPWDGTMKGKPMPFDTYYYIIEPGNGRDPITGYVTIIK